MKTNTTIKSIGMAAIAALMLASPAQAAMGGCLFVTPPAAGAPGCAGDTGNGQACPLQGGNAKGNCATGNQAPAGMMGNMAAGGIQIAASVLRALAGEANRQLAADPGM